MKNRKKSRKQITRFDVIASNLLQKSIRRSKTQLALRAAFRLSAFDRSYTWRRLLIIAFEDVGAAKPDALIETVALATTPEWRARRGEQACLAYAVVRLAEAPKDRSADYLISAAEAHPSLGDDRESCLRADLENRLRIVRDLSQPLPIRSLATWLSSGSRGIQRSSHRRRRSEASFPDPSRAWSKRRLCLGNDIGGQAHARANGRARSAHLA
jgi:hypothetical protein